MAAETTRRRLPRDERRASIIDAAGVMFGERGYEGARLEEFLAETARGAREGLYNARNMPTSFRAAAWIADLAQRNRNETVMCSPPPALQRVVTPLLARFAK